jgi:hypothetical protein
MIEERLAFVEGRVVEHSQMFSDLREGMSSLALRIDRLEERMDRRFEQVDARFLQVEARLDLLGTEMSKNFRWLVGIQVTATITVIAALVGTLAAR